MMASEGKKIKSLGATFAELYAAQGIKGFYRGLDANIMRAMVLNGQCIRAPPRTLAARARPLLPGTKMGCYDQIKHEIVKFNVFPAKSLVRGGRKDSGDPRWAHAHTHAAALPSQATTFCAAFGAGFFVRWHRGSC